MRRRWHPVLIGVVASLAGLAAAVGVLIAIGDGGSEGPPEPETELTFDADDDESGADDLIGGAVEGEPAPETSFNLLDGGTLAFADLRGTPVVVNFFASWCAPCVEEMPAFEAVHQELGERVAFVGIDVRDSVEAARDLIAQTGVTYTIGRDPSGGLFQAFEAVNMPSTFLISANGTVVHGITGAVDGDELRARINEHLLQ